MRATLPAMSKFAAMPVATVYPPYVAKLERKGHTRAEPDHVIEWLTGFDGPALARQGDGEGASGLAGRDGDAVVVEVPRPKASDA